MMKMQIWSYSFAVTLYIYNRATVTYKFIVVTLYHDYVYELKALYIVTAIIVVTLKV